MSSSSSNSGNGDSGSGDGLHIVMFPHLAFGHISPFLQLARKLVTTDPTIRITFLSAPGNVSRISSLLPKSVLPSVSVHSIPLPAIPGLPSGAESTADLTPSEATLLLVAIDAMKPDVRSLLSRLAPHFVVFDFAQSWIPSIATPLGIKSLFFSVFSAISSAYLTVPSRGQPTPTDDEDLKSPPAGFPTAATSAIGGGVPAYQAQDFSYIFKVFVPGMPCVYDRVVSCMKNCTAIIAKTCVEMEGQYIRYVESQYQKPMLLAGPVVPLHHDDDDDDDDDEKQQVVLEERWWAEWLDKFEKGSVVYCSFGSETLLTDQGIKELMLGLEMTGRPFFAVLNSPGPKGAETMRSKLPHGFEERVRGRGVIHHGWVQQQLILSHKSVGCFVNHAGFSSLVEGLIGECKLVLLPQRGDQYLNASLFSGDLGVGAQVKREEGTGEFVKEAVCEAVQMVMDPDINKNSSSSENECKWRDFLTDKEIQERFTVEFVHKLKELYLS